MVLGFRVFGDLVASSPAHSSCCQCVGRSAAHCGVCPFGLSIRGMVSGSFVTDEVCCGAERPY